MKQKIFVLVVTLLMTLCSVIVPRNIEVVASGEYGDPDIDHGYIYNKTDSLSQIVFNPLYWETSRFHGTDGEQQAARNIEDWMINIGLENVHNETINSCWTKEDENIEPEYSLYLGQLDRARVMNDFFLNITIYNTDTWSIVDYKNLSWTQCFPYYRKAHPIVTKYTNKENDIPIYEDFNPLDFTKHMELGDTHYSKTFNRFGTIYDEYHQNFPWRSFQGIFPNYGGWITIDNDTEAFPQYPPQYDQLKFMGAFEKQGFFVNGSIGTWIRNTVNNPDL